MINQLYIRTRFDVFIPEACLIIECIEPTKDIKHSKKMYKIIELTNNLNPTRIDYVSEFYIREYIRDGILKVQCITDSEIERIKKLAALVEL